MIAGPRGAQLVVEPGHDVPLVWIRVAALGGSAADPPGHEGLMRHAALLSRRGAGDRDRAALDDALDGLGASLQVSASRDAITVSGLCLARNADALVALMADVMARPRMEEVEHEKLLRETGAALDELRDDDGDVADRFFAREVAPGHPYARTSIGTETSLDQLDLAEVRRAHAAALVPGNLIVGVAGAVDTAAAEAMAERLVAGLPDAPAPGLPALPDVAPAAARRLCLIDKPERVQSQIRIGHPAPAYAHPDFAALSCAETIFGGTFSARLMQEIRAKRGWSYGAGCSLGRNRGTSWLRIALAPAAEVTPDAAALTMQLFEALREGGVTADELAFARSHMVGSMPFLSATPAQRMRLAVRNLGYGLPADYHERLRAGIAELTVDQVNSAIRLHFHPQATVSVIVATAASMAARLEPLGLGVPAVLAYDSY